MNPLSKALVSIALLFVCTACNSPASRAQRQEPDQRVRKVSLDAPKGRALAAFAEGCFWCVEEVFEAVQGVDSVIAGYAGGTTPAPTYQAVGSGRTDHAESVLVTSPPLTATSDYSTTATWSSSANPPPSPSATPT